MQELPFEQLSRPGGGRVKPVEHAELLVEERLLGGVRENVPGLGNKPESMIGVGKVVPVRVEKESESAVLSRDEFEVLSVVSELENRVPVGLLTVEVDPRVAGEERVGNGDYLLGCLESRVGLSGSDRETLSPLQVTCR